MPDSLRPRVALAMGSEGIRAFAAIPVFQFLKKEGFGPDLLTGSGGGALIAALAGAGFDLGQVEDAFRSLSDRRLFTELDPVAALGMAGDPSGRFSADTALVNPANLRAVYNRIFRGMKLEDLSPRTVLVCTDLRTGSPVALSTGPVADAVYAAGCPFPLTPPLVRDGLWLADGSYSQPIPTLEATRAGMEVVIGVYAQDEFSVLPAGFSESYLNVIRSFRMALVRSQTFQAIEATGQELVMVMAQPGKHAPPIPGQAPGQIRAEGLDAILKAGEEALARKQESIRAAISNASGVAARNETGLPRLEEPD